MLKLLLLMMMAGEPWAMCRLFDVRLPGVIAGEARRWSLSVLRAVVLLSPTGCFGKIVAAAAVSPWEKLSPVEWRTCQKIADFSSVSLKKVVAVSHAN